MQNIAFETSKGGEKMTKKVMALLDAATGRMKCKVCGKEHFASVRSGGHYYKGSWQCVNGCKI